MLTERQADAAGAEEPLNDDVLEQLADGLDRGGVTDPWIRAHLRDALRLMISRAPAPADAAAACPGSHAMSHLLDAKYAARL